MNKIFLFSGFLLLLMHFSSAQSVSKTDVEIYPTHWWVGMKNPNLQLMIHGHNIAERVYGKPLPKIGAEIAEGLILKKISRAESPNYVFLDLVVTKNAKPGSRILSLNDPSGRPISYELKARRQGNGIHYAQGVTAADLLYLIMPDRFSNGDYSNDKFPDLNDTSSDRSSPFLRHGGDLQGIINHLDYFGDLGVTALWLTPVVENNQSLSHEGEAMRSSYHGYHFTNQYQIDKRFGGNDAYKRLVSEAHAKGLKIIQDAVYNHFGNKHFLFLDPPSRDWFNQWPKYTNTSYNDQPLVDRYASQYDYNISVNGWFTPFLPDVNQRNPYVARFLIQYAIWAVEEFGIDGWRVDTYFYSDKNFLNDINAALYAEYPRISIFGETTTGSVTEQAYFMQNNLDVPWKSNLQGVTDYEWFDGALGSLAEKSGSPGGASSLYNKLVQDILYKDPMRNEIFLDNHDQNRVYSVVGEDFDKFKMGIALLLTQRGIPQIYYGTEILMKNFMNPSDAEVRKDFPGGWKEDSVNKFEASGRTAQENEAYNYVKTLAHYRLGSSAITKGRLMQFVPSNGLYTYFRYDKKQTVMCVMNGSDKEKGIDFTNYAERTQGFKKARNVVDNTVYLLTERPVIPAKHLWVLELN